MDFHELFVRLAQGTARLIPGIANNPTLLRGSSAEAGDVQNTEGEL